MSQRVLALAFRLQYIRFWEKEKGKSLALPPFVAPDWAPGHMPRILIVDAETDVLFGHDRGVNPILGICSWHKRLSSYRCRI
jgi:hypothetical protein